ncbi:MAG: 16S rRNA (uracil(1498)-N(3))-methyltransferase, partial [Endomicrobiales bacterium]|nr:16S rRNA (uracil(1498)-N(3))-methyltransferase [Endomicrobiales bacterium]
EITKKQVRIIIENFQAKNISSPLNITLGQGISRGEKMDFIIQKSVELGVHTIAPIVTERSSFKLSDERQTNKLRHWQSIAIHASEQSGRCDIAQISTIQPLATWLNSQRGLCLVLDPNARNNLKHALEQSKQNNKIDAITLLIGPEGGLSADEIQLAVKYNFRPIKFGPRILRTETAGLAIVSVLQYLLGDVA